ncbi:MAG: hypothetical protein JO321_16065 [Solirubrobacterales bacterium]|nr:hypothetical protein [Solirubrobacterales bacterium]MBV8940631.1 hypothetical protein [Solirubrobacterales bacterium]MBV9167250.1 hypothetical protein [Solirubrobacterales bacterium]MBV9536916.1 hypothetical protein [Solirubrobacterales bacterium]
MSIGCSAISRPLATLRAAGLLLLVCAFAAPAALAAHAGTKSYSGKIEQGGTISFKAAVNHGRVTRVGTFNYRGVPTTCKSRFSGVVAGTAGGATVRHHTFVAKSVATGGQHETVTGRFSSNYKKVSGTFRVTGNYPPYTGCTTGTDHWSAKRG